MIIKTVLKNVVNWLDRKFPDKVEITLHEFNQFHEELGMLNREVQQLLQLQPKLDALQKDLDLVKSNLGYLGTRNQIKPLER